MSNSENGSSKEAFNMFSLLQSEFTKSSSTLSEMPVDGLPEFAFIGRSNVGKSSLINLLTKRKSLAKISSVPGKTQLINHFKLLTDRKKLPEVYFVDLPGYGFAKTSKTQKAKFTPMITNYVTKAPRLVNLFLLIDIRHVDQKIDHEFIEYLGVKGIPFTIVLTKADKLSKNQQAASAAQLRKILKKDWEEVPTMLQTSTLKKSGGEEVYEYIDEVLNDLA